MKSIKLTIKVPEFGDKYPKMPPNATEWEQQEINQDWRMCCNAADNAMARIAYQLGQVNSGNIDTRPSCNDAQHLAQFHASYSRLIGRVQAVLHRNAVITKAKP